MDRENAQYLLMMRGLITSLEPADQEKVRLAAERIREVVKESGELGQQALTLVMLETAAAE